MRVVLRDSEADRRGLWCRDNDQHVAVLGKHGDDQLHPSGHPIHPLLGHQLIVIVVVLAVLTLPLSRGEAIGRLLADTTWPSSPMYRSYWLSSYKQAPWTLLINQQRTS